MKNLLRLSAFVCLVFSSLSCSKDAETVTVDSSEDLRTNLIGKWQYEKRDIIADGTELLVDYPHACATQKDNFILSVDNSYNPNDFNAACVESTLGNNIYFIKITNSKKIVNLAGFDNKIISLSATELKLSNVTSGFIYVLKKV